MSRATSAATMVLDPALVPTNAARALVRHLDARRADVWRFDGRRCVLLASEGDGGDAPATLPATLARIARGGLATVANSTELGAGVGTDWRRLLFAVDAHELCVHPLVVGERTIGAITVVPEPERADGAFEATSIFAHQVAASLQQADLHRAAQDAALAMRVQNRVLSELTDERDLGSLRTAVQQLVREILPEAGVVLLPVDTLGRLTIPDDESVTSRIASAHEVAAVLAPLRDCEAVHLPAVPARLVRDLGLDPREEGTVRPWAIRLGIGETPAGVLVLDCDHADDGRIGELLRALAPAVSIALENAQLFARESVRAERLAAANELARVAAGCLTRDELHGAVIGTIGSLFGYRRTALYDGALAIVVEEGLTRGRSSDRERALVSTTLHRRCASRVERPDRTCHALPLVTGDRIHAVLYAEQPTTVTPEQERDDLRILASICEHTAACLVAIETTERIERSYKDTIQALVHALEARDQYTADHSDVVAEWSLETGRRLGMDEDDLRDLELGAILHDIGKVAVPDGILNKPGRLTDEEFEVMKSHTVVGERILQPLGFLKNVAPIVRHEHERWDGRGYPDGISGTDIPLASRIIFVCDAYHAITSDRPYRAGQSHAFARRILVENAGTQFDPAVVSVFLDVIDQWCAEQGIATDDGDTGVEIVNPLRDASAEADAA